MCQLQPRTWFILRVAYAILGILIGVSVCFSFGLRFDNRNAAIWGLLSGVFAAIALLLFIYLYVMRERRGKPPSGLALMLFAAVGGLGIGAGVGGFVTYLGLGIVESVNHTEPELFRSYYIVCVWCFMTLKWAVTVYSYALRSARHLTTYYRGYTSVNDNT